MFFRSHPFAFSIDGNCQCLILCGNSETDSQLWMKELRHFLWPKNNGTPQSSYWLEEGIYYMIHFFVSWGFVTQCIYSFFVQVLNLFKKDYASLQHVEKLEKATSSMNIEIS